LFGASETLESFTGKIQFNIV